MLQRRGLEQLARRPATELSYFAAPELPTPLHPQTPETLARIYSVTGGTHKLDQITHGGLAVVVILVLHVVVRVHRRRCRLRHQAVGLASRHSCGKRQVPVQLRRQDPPPPFRRRAALRRRPQPRPLRRPFPPVLRAATEAPGDVRLGREPAVPAADGGPGRARLRDERRRPRQPSRGVRRGQQGPPRAAQDQGVPVPAGSVHAAEQLAVHAAARIQAVAERSPAQATQFSCRPRLADVRAAVVGCAAAGLPPGASPAAAGAGARVPRPQRQPLAITKRRTQTMSSFACVRGVARTASRARTHRVGCM